MEGLIMYDDVQNRWALPLDQHPELNFDADLASVLVIPTEPGVAPFFEARRRLGIGVHVDVRAKGGTTYVHVSAAEEAFMGFWGDPSLILHVPMDLRGRIHTNGGRIHAKMLHGCSVELFTEGGAIVAENLSGRLRLATHAGKIDGTELSGALDVESNAGAIKLTIVGLDPGIHRVRTNVGALRIDLAKGLAVRVDAHTDVGKTRVDYPQVTEAPAVLELSADVGAIRVRERVLPTPPHYVQAPAVAVEQGPYRTPPSAPIASPIDKVELARILALVEAGKLSAREAAELLTSFGL